MQESAAGTWVPHEHLSGEHLLSLHDLNLRFLNLLSNLACATPHMAAVTALTQTQRTAAANCPYALFDVRFGDEVFWTARLAMAHVWRVADGYEHHPLRVDFVRSALFYAWHVSAAADRSPQLQLGMSPNTAAAFRLTAMDGLSLLAVSEASRLAPRWQDCGAYWSALANAAAGGNSGELRRVQLYGLQLTAAARLPED